MALPSLFATVLLPVFPLHAEIDFGPLVQRPPVAYRVRITAETASGKKVVMPITLGAEANAEDAMLIAFGGFEQAKWEARRQGIAIIVSGQAGSPVKKVTIEGNDNPKPTFRWVPRQK
jgi:hypothetical protein